MAVNQVNRKRVIINFKNTPEDLALYNELKKHSSISGYIKDILRGVIALDIKDNKTIEVSKKHYEDKEKIDIDDVLGEI